MIPSPLPKGEQEFKVNPYFPSFAPSRLNHSDTTGINITSESFKKKKAYKVTATLSSGILDKDEIIKMGKYRSNPCKHEVRVEIKLYATPDILCSSQ